jgi:UDP-N-acetylmuramoylalanine--D-glutamate ligase
MNWTGKRVVVIGAARQGIALSRYLAQQGAQVVLTDARAADELAEARAALAGLPVRWETGGHPLSLLDEADLVCPSGGVPLTIPLVVEARRRGIPLSNDSQVFVAAVPCPVVGITGSAGKTTTTTLVGRMADQAAKLGVYRQAFTGGNIGRPLLAVLDEITPEDITVVEFSSFQLELMTVSPEVAAVLNISPNHLDRHGTMDAYVAAKKNIFLHQRPTDALIVGIEDPQSLRLAAETPGRVFGFGRTIPDEMPGAFIREEQIFLRGESGEQAVMPIVGISLRGGHNLLNVLAACALAEAAGLPVKAIRAGIEGFGGVEHRLEFVTEVDGVQWYNDSKATSPGMTVTAMQAFSEPLIVLAGGRDKRLPWNGFAEQARRQARHVIAFGEAGDLVAGAVRKLDPSQDVLGLTRCASLTEAVEAAAALAQPGDVVLLAPGGTSFDEFTDFEARGQRFKELVLALAAKEKKA